MFDKTYRAFNWKNLKFLAQLILGSNGLKKSKHYPGIMKYLEVGFHSFRFIDSRVLRELYMYAGIPAISSLQHALVKCTIPTGSLYRYNAKYNEIISSHIRVDALYVRIVSPVIDHHQLPENNITILHRPANYIGVEFKGKCEEFNTLPIADRLAYANWLKESVSS